MTTPNDATDDAPSTRRVLPDTLERERAERTSQSAPAPRGALYEIVISYKEPTFAEHAGQEARTFRGTFRIEAADEDDARVRAVAEFRRIQASSSVGWQREIVDVACRRADP
ncbi:MULTISPECIES: hypothetical protein [Polyangium]|uniref:Uncharacterized protein n=2 Tax=Polyangium TaxID=55 RepID=A0A4U1IWU6_9BACT|nr:MULTISPECIES: hypothetical protein [Polyangium]MDI1428752.1 hypothetical protein [Polyangium sorediatum]TKC98996.1 hypothetical protein E8A74_39225 [Polyangium fumosum]